MGSLGGECLSSFFIAVKQHPGKSNLKGKRLLLAYISLMAGKTEQQVCEVAGYTASAVRKQRETMLVLRSLSTFYSVQISSSFK